MKHTIKQLELRRHLLTEHHLRKERDRARRDRDKAMRFAAIQENRAKAAERALNDKFKELQ